MGGEQIYLKLYDVMDELIARYGRKQIDINTPDDYHDYALAIKTGLERIQELLENPNPDTEQLIRGLDFEKIPEISKIAEPGAYKMLERHRKQALEDLKKPPQDITIDDYII